MKNVFFDILQPLPVCYSFVLSCISGYSSTLWTPLTKTRVQTRASAWRPPSFMWSTLWFSPSSSSISLWLWSSSPFRSRETRPCQSAAWRRMRCTSHLFLPYMLTQLSGSKHFKKFEFWAYPGLLLGKLDPSRFALCSHKGPNDPGLVFTAVFSSSDAR